MSLLGNIRTGLADVLTGRSSRDRYIAKETMRMVQTAASGRTRDAMYRRAAEDAANAPDPFEHLPDARRAQFYAGANPGTARPYPRQLNTPEDYKEAYERIVLIRAARQMEEDFPFFDGILSDFTTYVVGDLQYMPETGDPAADAVIRDYLDLQFATCDMQQTRDLKKLTDLAIRTYKRDGECGFVMVDTGREIKLMAMSADRIGNPLVGANIGPNNYNGIIVNGDDGSPMFYDLYRRLPKMNAYVFQQRIDADQFIHLFDPYRFEQYHGVTAFKNAIEHAFDIYQIVQFSKLNIKYRSSQLPWVKNEQGQPRGGYFASQTPDPSTGQITPMSFTVDGVKQQFWKLGEGVMEFPNDFPNGQFLPMISELKRDCALGAKLPAEFCYRSETGGVIQRFYVSKARATFDEDKRLLKTRFLETYKNRSIQKGIDSGDLDLSAFGNLSSSMARFRGRWQMGRSITVDYGKEVDADIKLIDAGLMSPDHFCAEQGADIRVIRQQNKNHALQLFQDAADVAKKAGQPIATVLPFLLKKFANQSGSGAGGLTGGGSGGLPGAAAVGEEVPIKRGAIDTGTGFVNPVGWPNPSQNSEEVPEAPPDNP